MADFPALPLWTDSWVADTKHLSRTERGTYCDLLVLMWRSPGCRVPNDDVWLGKRLGMTPAEVTTELRPLIAEFCKNDGNWLMQKRLSREFGYVTEQRRLQSERAKSRWNKDKKNTGVYAESGNAPTPTPTPVEKESTAIAVPKKSRKTQFPADWMPNEGDRNHASQQGYDDVWIDEQALACRDYHRGKGNTFSDLSATWRTWIRNSKRFNRGTRGTRTTPLESLYRGAAIAIERRETQRQADSRTGDDAAQPLLDSGGGRTLEGAANLRLVG